MITLVVFSKDRAMQCHSLLQSVEDHCTGIDRVVVLAKASSALHIAAYRRLLERCMCDELTVNDSHGGLPLGEDIFQAVNDSEHTALAVDDMTFYAPSDFARATDALNYGFSWSWRLGEKPDPDHDTFDDHDTWMYSSMLTGDADYGYMFHCDGMVIKTDNYLKMLDRYLPNWRTGSYIPNDLEAAVAAKKSRWAAAVYPHRGPLTPTCITWQLNRVQLEYNSPAAEIPETNTDTLARAYLEGKRVDNDALYGALNANPLRWNPPGARPTHIYACEEASKFWASCIR
jgi:hypothetical protein